MNHANAYGSIKLHSITHLNTALQRRSNHAFSVCVGPLMQSYISMCDVMHICGHLCRCENYMSRAILNPKLTHRAHDKGITCSVLLSHSTHSTHI